MSVARKEENQNKKMSTRVSTRHAKSVRHIERGMRNLDTAGLAARATNGRRHQNTD
jgi:hypothetical protein